MPKTGETCEIEGYYKFAGHIDDSIGCHPTYEEQEIPMHQGNTFPPIKSCRKGANWIYSRSL